MTALSAFFKVDFYFVSSIPTIPTSIRRAKSILWSDAESPKNVAPMMNVPNAPAPVQMMYAVLTGIVFCAS